jgi:hypothetical protein
MRYRLLSLAIVSLSFAAVSSAAEGGPKAMTAPAPALAQPAAATPAPATKAEPMQAVTIAAPTAEPEVMAPAVRGNAPVTIADRFAAAAKEADVTSVDLTRATEILPGMDVTALAERLGAPQRIKERDGLTEARWSTDQERAPVFIVWLRNDRAVRMRLLDY